MKENVEKKIVVRNDEIGKLLNTPRQKYIKTLKIEGMLKRKMKNGKLIRCVKNMVKEKKKY